MSWVIAGRTCHLRLDATGWAGSEVPGAPSPLMMVVTAIY